MAKPIRISGEIDFEKLLDRLSHDIVEAPALLRLHKVLSEKFGEYHREVSQSAFFWRFCATSVREAGLLRLARIFDQEKSALSLRTLLLTLQANPHLFEDAAVRRRVSPLYAEEMAPGSHSLKPDKIREDLALVFKNEPLVRKIILWRNTLGAHVSPTRMLKGSFSKTDELSWEEAFSLCSRAFDIFNRCTSLFHATETSTMIVGEEGSAASVFKYLRLGVAAYEKEIDEEYQRMDEKIRRARESK
jgi:hypothetical protein